MSHVPRITLKQGKEKPLLRGHPWVFSGAVAKIEGDISPGDMGEVYSKDGQFLGTGYVNPHSQIIFRLLGREKLGSLDQLVRRRIARADIPERSTVQRQNQCVSPRERGRGLSSGTGAGPLRGDLGSANLDGRDGAIETGLDRHFGQRPSSTDDLREERCSDTKRRRVARKSRPPLRGGDHRSYRHRRIRLSIQGRREEGAKNRFLP